MKQAKREYTRGLIVNDKDQVLILNNIPRGTDFYKRPLGTFPGGGVEPGETPEQGIIRECEEELDILVTEIKKITTITDKNTGNLIHLYHIKKYEGPIKNKEPHKVSSISMLPFDEDKWGRMEGVYEDARLAYLAYMGKR